jgi:hypothetical protein
MAFTVPLQATPSQTLTTTLGGQGCQLNVYQKSTGLFMDVIVNNVLIIGGVVCENLNRIVRSAYLGFIGDFVFLDTQGTSDPTYTGLGSRYVLIYLTAADLAAGVTSSG